MSTETTTEQVQDPTAIEPTDPTTPPQLTGQEAIEAEFAKQQEAEIAQALADAERETPDGSTPDEAPGGESTPPPQGSGEEKPAADANPTPTPENTPGEDDAMAKMRRDAERAAFGKLGNRIQQQDKRIAELEALLATKGAEGGGNQEPKSEPAKPKAQSNLDPDAPISDEERAALLGDNWEADWGKDGADDEVRKIRRTIRYYGGGQAATDLKAAVREEIDAERAAAAREAAVERIWGDLEAAVPGAAALNEGAEGNGFADYLDGIQPGTAQSRREVADDALRRIREGATGEAYERAKQVVVDVFKGFGAKTAPTQPPSTIRGPSAKAAPIDPTRYVAPGGGGGRANAPGGAQARKTYKRSAADAYLDRASAEGEAAFQKAYEWYCRQEAAGTLVD